MQKYASVVQDKTGRAIKGAQVLVKKSDNSSATIYSDNGSTVIAGATVTTDGFGGFAFYAADGRYNLYVTVNGSAVGQLLDILLEDPADGSPIAIVGGTVTNSAITGGTMAGTAISGGSMTGTALSAITIDGVAVTGSDLAKYSRLDDADGGTLIGNTPSGGIAATTVQGAINELDAEKARSDTLAASGGAALIGNTPAGGIASTTVQAALNELDTKKVASAALAATSGATLVGFVQAGTGASLVRTMQDKGREIISSEDYFLAAEAYQDPQLQRAIDYAMANGKHRVTLNSPHTLNGPVTIASNSNALTVDGNVSLVTLNSSTAGFIVKGAKHRLQNIDFAQANLAHTPTAVKVTADATFANTQHVYLVNLRGVNIYRGIQATMPSPSQVCYRINVIECRFENFNLQKTWAGSFGVSFDGPTEGNAAGNDSTILGGFVKGYENNVIVQNSVGTQIINLSNDIGGSGIRYDGGSHLRVIGGYNEYSDNIITAVNNPTYLHWYAPTVSNYTTFLNGTIAGGVFGLPPIGGFTAGGVDFITGPWKSTTTGFAEAFATNGVKVGQLADVANLAAVKGVFTTTTTFSFGSIAAGGNANTGTISVPGASANSMVNITCINASLPNGSLNFFGSPGANVVTVFCQNVSNGAITADNVQLRITVIKF